MADNAPFPRLVPGFDFLQDLVKGAGAAMPGMGQWVAPTLDPDELGKRIEELRTVQFWLEQNARVLATTVQALEVQRMTLSTLKSMNVSMGDMADALKVRPAAAQPAAADPPAAAPRRRRAGSAKAAASAKPGAAQAAPTAGAIDPMQWWGALTRQFTDLAAQALREGAAAAPGSASSASSQGAAAASPSGASAGSASAVAGAPGRSAARKAGGDGSPPAAGAKRGGSPRATSARRPSASSSSR